MHKLDLLIDSNFILNKLIFNLFSEKRLYIDLHDELLHNFKSILSLYNFNKVYIVADSNKKSWRKSLLDTYKGDRKKDESIDWNLVHDIYTNFLLYMKEYNKSYILLRRDNIEADDFIAMVVLKNNENNISNFIVSNDHDLKQLLVYNKKTDTINIMSNEFRTKNERVFVPYDYKIYLSNRYNETVDSSQLDIFDLDSFDDSKKEHVFIDKHIRYKNIVEVDDTRSLFVKLVSGDKSDSIKSIYTLNNRGIGSKGAEKIYDLFLNEYGKPMFNDSILDNDQLFDEIIDIVTESKKIKSINISEIKEKLILNFKLIYLKKLPTKVENIIYNIINENYVEKSEY